MFSVRILRDSVFEQGCFFRCCAIELVSDRGIVNRFHSVVEIKPTYTLLFLEIQSPKYTSTNDKHFQSSNIHAKVTSLLQYTHP